MANEPITREEMLLNAVATGEATNLKPITREEMFLAKLGGADVTTPTPITRKEQFLQKAIESDGSGGSGGGGDASTLTKLIERTISGDLVNNQITTVGEYAFYSCSNLISVNFPVATMVGDNAFYNCKSLTTVNFPAVTSINACAFENCTSLTTVNFPAVTNINAAIFRGCSALTTVDFPVATMVGNNAFNSCKKLTALILRNTAQVATLKNSVVFTGSPIASGNGYIYVPAALVDSYKSATNWSTYANKLRALEDYTVDGTVTGELDPNKI